jgi:hypothetical protein
MNIEDQHLESLVVQLLEAILEYGDSELRDEALRIVEPYEKRWFHK